MEVTRRTRTEEEAACSSNTHSTKRTRANEKPEAVIAYNKGKSGIDLSDQMASYGTTLRKGGQMVPEIEDRNFSRYQHCKCTCIISGNKRKKN